MKNKQIIDLSKITEIIHENRTGYIDIEAFLKEISQIFIISAKKLKQAINHYVIVNN